MAGRMSAAEDVSVELSARGDGGIALLRVQPTMAALAGPTTQNRSTTAPTGERGRCIDPVLLANVVT